MELSGKTVIITGGSNGIGKACALAMAEKKANVIVADIEELSQDSQTKQYPNLHYVKTDITKLEDVDNLGNFAINTTGRIDVLINNAAKQIVSDFFDMTIQQWEEVIDVNLTGTFLCSQILGKQMR